MKRNQLFRLFTLVLICLSVIALFTSCADTQPQIKECAIGYQYGFWSGVWHGLIAPFAFIGSLFSDNIAVFAVNNTGNWYVFGFLSGLGSLTNLLVVIAKIVFWIVKRVLI